MVKHPGDPQNPPVFGTGPGLILTTLTVLIVLLPIADGLLKNLGLPNLVLVPVFFLTLGKREAIGPVGAFLAGLGIDILTFGPLGVTAASLTLIHMVLRHERPMMLALPGLFRLVGFLLSAIVILGFSLLVRWGLDLGPLPDPMEVLFVVCGLLAVGATCEGLLGYLASGPRRNRLAGRLPRRVKHRVSRWTTGKRRRISRPLNRLGGARR